MVSETSVKLQIQQIHPLVDDQYNAPERQTVGRNLVRKPLSTSLRDVFFAIVASGTATLETALAEVPMVVVYRVGKLSYLIGKKLISVPHISLVNLIAGREVVPELIQDDVDAQNICLRAEEIIDHQDKFDQVVEGLMEVKSLLGPAGGAERAAREVVDCLKI